MERLRQILLFFSLFSWFANGHAQTYKSHYYNLMQFKPKLALGGYYENPFVLEGEIAKIAGIRAAYNFNLLPNYRKNSLVLEPALGIGQAWFPQYKSYNNYAMSLDLAFLYRKKIGPVSIGIGAITGFTTIKDYYTYAGYLGLSSRLGYLISQKLMIELHGNVQLGGFDSKASTGISLIWLHFNEGPSPNYNW